MYECSDCGALRDSLLHIQQHLDSLGHEGYIIDGEDD